MPRLLRPLLCLAASLPAVSPVPAQAANDGASANISSATGITFAGYEKDASGRRLWLLSADRASPKPDPKAKNTWLLERIKIRAFDKSAAEMAVIAAPAAEYASDEKSAHDSGPVAVTGKMLTLSGRGWTWINPASNRHDITITSEVRVVVTPQSAPGAKEKPAIVITANRLHAVMDTTGTRLEFSDDVRATQAETTVTCAKLSTFVKGAAGNFTPAKSGEIPVDRIDAEGGVSLTRKGTARITGRTATIIPNDGTYSVTGDAEFSDLTDNRVKVSGDSMVLRQTTPLGKNNRSGVVTVTPKADAKDGRVVAELPVFDPGRANDPRNAAQRSHASGKTLEIDITPKGYEVRIDGDVHLTDPDYTGGCEKLTIETSPAGPGNEILGTKSKLEALRRIIAEDSVVLSRDGRTVSCERAEITTESKSASRIALTGAPRAEDARTGSVMNATRMTIIRNRDEDTDSLVAESGPSSPVTLEVTPLRNSAVKGLPPGTTRVEAAKAVASHRTPAPSLRRGGLKDIGVFEFEGAVKLAGEGLSGSCERLGIEVGDYDTDIRRLQHRVHRIVAVGGVKLEQTGYTAEAGRAEIIPGAKLHELSVRDDNGLDGPAPFHVTLSTDESSPGLRPKTGVAGITIPTPGADRTASIRDEDKMEKSFTTVESDFQELIQGEERLRAFATGSVKIAGKDLRGTAASLELLGLKNPVAQKPPGKTPDGDDKFAMNTLVARGGVEMFFLDAKNGKENRAAADTFEISPGPLAKEVSKENGMLILSGHPVLDGWPTVPGSERKILRWNTVAGPDGKPRTELKLKDELSKGMPSQIIRPRLVVPIEGVPDLGRSLKSLDKGA